MNILQSLNVPEIDLDRLENFIGTLNNDPEEVLINLSDGRQLIITAVSEEDIIDEIGVISSNEKDWSWCLAIQVNENNQFGKLTFFTSLSGDYLACKVYENFISSEEAQKYLV